jgi:hypothetical protein
MQSKILNFPCRLVRYSSIPIKISKPEGHYSAIVHAYTGLDVMQLKNSDESTEKSCSWTGLT